MGSFERVKLKMAVYMLMIKNFEDEEKVVYSFGPNETKLGEIEYNKTDKKLSVVSEVNDENIANESYVKWASHRIGQILYREGGNFPDRTSVER